MLRAIELAKKGLGYVSPNPLVGCVIVSDDKIIGEGYHVKYGGPHAEVNAVNSVKDKSLLHKSIVYVNLEPCSHHGKTPPCADLLIKNKVNKVVIANTDPNPLVSGRGIEKLKANNIDVQVGICDQLGMVLNRRFFTSIKKDRPYIILKWAQTNDGYIARSNFDSKWISNASSRKLVHKWRSEEDAILVGYRTAYHDNPRLNVRDWDGRDPLRIYIDYNNALPEDFHLKDGSQKTLCYTQGKYYDDQLEFVQLAKQNFTQNLLKDLSYKKIQSVIIEGGSTIINTFIKNNLWDEARVFIGNTTFEGGIKAPIIDKKFDKKEIIEGDQLLYYFNI